MKKRTFNILLIGACAACIGTAAVGFGSCKDSAASGKTEISNKAPVLPEKEENITKINDNDLLNVVKQESGNTASGAEAGAETAMPATRLVTRAQKRAKQFRVQTQAILKTRLKITPATYLPSGNLPKWL